MFINLISTNIKVNSEWFNIKRAFKTYVSLKMYLLFAVIFCYNFVEGTDINNGETLCNNFCICYTRTDYILQMPIIQVDCSLRSIRQFDFNYSLPLLTTVLDLSRNKLGQLKEDNKLLKSMTVQTLDISRNKIVHIKQGYFKNLPNLLKLDLSENYLETISDDIFLGLYKLQELDLSFNRLKMLPKQIFKDLNNLKIISLSYNSGLGLFLLEGNKLFKEDGLSLTKNLKVLRLENMTLTSFPQSFIKNVNNLTELYISENPIQKLSLSMPSTLEVLDLSGTKISKLTSNLLPCPLLKYLYVNRAYNLTKIEPYAFYFLDKILTISLENCIALTSFNDLVFGYEKISETFPDHTLKKLSLARSGLTKLNKTLIHFLKRTSKIDLDGNPWICDCDLEWLRELTINLDSLYLRCNAPLLLKFQTFNNVTGKSCNLNKDISVLNIILVIIFVTILILASLIIWNGQFGKDSKVQLSRRMGPNSPYSHITIEPNNAEM